MKKKKNHRACILKLKKKNWLSRDTESVFCGGKLFMETNLWEHCQPHTEWFSFWICRSVLLADVYLQMRGYRWERFSNIVWIRNQDTLVAYTRIDFRHSVSSSHKKQLTVPCLCTGSVMISILWSHVTGRTWDRWGALDFMAARCHRKQET